MNVLHFYHDDRRQNEESLTIRPRLKAIGSYETVRLATTDGMLSLWWLMYHVMATGW